MDRYMTLNPYSDLPHYIGSGVRLSETFLPGSGWYCYCLTLA